MIRAGCRMDWKQFIASLVGSLAWPAIICYLLYLLRSEIIGLASRLDELSIGGYRAKFISALKTAQDADVAASNAVARPAAEAPVDETTVHMDTVAPFASVLLGYAELERVLVAIRQKLVLPTRTNPISIVRELADRGLVTSDTVEAFNSLRLARNAAAHAQRTITSADAANFNYTARRLLEVFQSAKDSL